MEESVRIAIDRDSDGSFGGRISCFAGIPCILCIGEVPVVRSVCREVKHVLSHRVIYANLYEVTLSENLTSFGDFQKIKVEELEQYAISRLVQTLLQALNGKY